jgi:hypothetical protein
VSSQPRVPTSLAAVLDFLIGFSSRWTRVTPAWPPIARHYSTVRLVLFRRGAHRRRATKSWQDSADMGIQYPEVPRRAKWRDRHGPLGDSAVAVFVSHRWDEPALYE